MLCIRNNMANNTNRGDEKMGIANKFFFQDESGAIRLNINEEMFDIMVSEQKESKEMMMILCIELFRELDEVATKLLDFELDEQTYNLVNLIKKNHNNYIINQAKMIEKIEEIEGGS